MKSLNLLRTEEQEIVLQRLNTLFSRLIWGRKPYRTMLPLCGTVYLKLLKKQIIFKYNVENLYLNQ